MSTNISNSIKNKNAFLDANDNELQPHSIPSSIAIETSHKKKTHMEHVSDALRKQKK